MMFPIFHNAKYKEFMLDSEEWKMCTERQIKLLKQKYGFAI